MSYDVSSYDLAESFLQNYIVPPERKEAVTDRLAQAIQNIIEDVLGEMSDEHLILEKP